MTYEIYPLAFLATCILLLEFVPPVIERCGIAAEKFYELLARIKRCRARLARSKR